jgi:hypothetical protein
VLGPVITVEGLHDHQPFQCLAAELDQLLACRPLRRRDRHLRRLQLGLLAQAGEIDRRGDEHQAVRLACQHGAHDLAEVGVGPGLEGHRGDRPAAQAAERGLELPEPRFGEGAVAQVVRHRDPALALREQSSCVVVGVVTGRAVDPEQVVVVAVEVHRRDGRTHHHHLLAVDVRKRCRSHRAGEGTDDGLHLRLDQLVRALRCDLPRLRVVTRHELQRPAVDATGRVALLERELHPVASGLADIGGTIAQPAEEADADGLRRLAAEQGEARQGEDEETACHRRLQQENCRECVVMKVYN